MALERGIDTKPQRKYGAGVNADTQALANQGLSIQEKSKQSLQRSLAKVHETNLIASDAV